MSTRDEMVDALRTAVEVTHGYRPAPMSAYTFDANADAARLICDCGRLFSSTLTHRQHVYESAVDAMLAVSHV